MEFLSLRNKTNKEKIVVIVNLFVIIATIMFIFSNSIFNKQESIEQSSKLKALLKPIIELFLGEGNLTDHLFRKMAHFAEFALLGFELSILTKKIILSNFFISILVALTDETIQIFTGRGPTVQDVWLDFSGAIFGIIIGLLIYNLLTNLKKSTQKKT